jgi:ergothioneine biosynthesis protein EgtB
MTTVDLEGRSLELERRYWSVRDRTEALAAPLSPEDQTVQSMPDVSPTKWHRGHTTWFFETFVLPRHDPGAGVFHPGYGYLFNSYYEAVGRRHPRDARGVISRPGAAEVGDYRAHVDKAMTQLFNERPQAETLALSELGLHHEEQHQELLLMDIKHVLSCNPLEPAYRPEPPAPAGGQRALGWVEHPGGTVLIGHEGGAFAFDNESPRHECLVAPFALADRLVTCGEWLAFMDDGGYRRPELWLSDGWAVVQQEGWDAPLYWRQDGSRWRVFTLGGTHPVDPDRPVCHVSYYEADAFAHWRGCRLPTEVEWEAVATAAPWPEGGDQLHPRVSTAALDDLSGSVWQWTSSAYSPYPGFRPAAGAVGEYNGKFMVSQQVLRGGACITPAGHSRPTYRNFFHPWCRWAFSGLRLAQDPR